MQPGIHASGDGDGASLLARFLDEDNSQQPVLFLGGRGSARLLRQAAGCRLHFYQDAKFMLGVEGIAYDDSLQAGPSLSVNAAHWRSGAGPAEAADGGGGGRPRGRARAPAQGRGPLLCPSGARGQGGGLRSPPGSLQGSATVTLGNDCLRTFLAFPGALLAARMDVVVVFGFYGRRTRFLHPPHPDPKPLVHVI